jgi:hypothetical protein
VRAEVELAAQWGKTQHYVAAASCRSRHDWQRGSALLELDADIKRIVLGLCVELVPIR